MTKRTSAMLALALMAAACSSAPSATPPRPGTYGGNAFGEADDASAIFLVTVDDDLAIPQMIVTLVCGDLRYSGAVDFDPPYDAAEGSFEVGAGRWRVEGTFTEEGKRVVGSWSMGDCETEWRGTWGEG